MYKVLKRDETGKLVSPIQYTQGKMLKSYGKKRKIIRRGKDAGDCVSR